MGGECYFWTKMKCCNVPFSLPKYLLFEKELKKGYPFLNTPQSDLRKLFQPYLACHSFVLRCRSMVRMKAGHYAWENVYFVLLHWFLDVWQFHLRCVTALAVP